MIDEVVPAATMQRVVDELDEVGPELGEHLAINAHLLSFSTIGFSRFSVKRL